MTYVKIDENKYPASISGVLKDSKWNDRESKTITLSMTYEEVNRLFVDDVSWSIIHDPEIENAEIIEYNNSDYSIAGPITDNRDGTITVKMGKLTAEEMLAILQEVM